MEKCKVWAVPYPRWICALTYDFSRCKNYDLFYHSKVTLYEETILAQTSYEKNTEMDQVQSDPLT
jgi:hypothetical protein